MSAVERVTGVLFQKRSELVDEFASRSEKHFVWLAELPDVLAKQKGESSASEVMLPKTPSRNKRDRTKRQPAKSKAGKTRTPLQEVGQKLFVRNLRNLRKRTVSICPVPQTEDSPAPVAPVAKAAGKTKAKATTPTTAVKASKSSRTRGRSTRSSRKPITPEPAEEQSDEEAECPDTVVKTGHRSETPEDQIMAMDDSGCPDTVGRPVTPEDQIMEDTYAPDTVVNTSTSTPQTLVKSRIANLAKNMQTPLTIVKARGMATPTAADSPATPSTVVTKAGSSKNLVDTQKTLAARFAAALQLATSPSPMSKAAAAGGNTKTPVSKIARSTSNKTPGVSHFIKQLEQKESATSGTPPPAAAAAKPRSGRQGKTAQSRLARAQPAKSKMNMVQAAAPTRKRKSAVVDEDDAAAAAISASAAPTDGYTPHFPADAARGGPRSGPSYGEIKKGVLAATRQFKRRLPTRKRRRYPAPEAEEENTPMEGEGDTTRAPAPGAVKKQASRIIMSSHSNEIAQAKAATREPEQKKKVEVSTVKFQRAQKLRDDASRKAAERAALRKAQLANVSSVAAASKAAAAVAAAVAPVRRRAEQDRANQKKAADDLRKKDEAQAARLEKDRQRKAKEAMEKKARNDAKIAEAARKRTDNEKGKRKEDESKLRREKLREQEKQLQAQMLARKKELEETKREFDKKLAKAKVQRAKDLEHREQERKEKERAAEEARAAKRAEREVEMAKLRAERKVEQEMVRKNQMEEVRLRDAQVARIALTRENVASPGSPFNSYDLSGLRSDASSDDEDDPREQVPNWAKGARLKNALLMQFIDTPKVKAKERAIFASPPAPVLSEIFPKKKSKFRPRTSSAHWEPSPNRTGLVKKRY